MLFSIMVDGLLRYMFKPNYTVGKGSDRGHIAILK